jgi:hypothetical protein
VTMDMAAKVYQRSIERENRRHLQRMAS